MDYYRNNTQLRLLAIKLVHFCLSLALFYIFWLLFRYQTPTADASIGYRYNYFTLIGYAIVLAFFDRTYNSYLLGFSRNSELVFSQIIAQLFSIVILYSIVTLAWRIIYNPIFFLPMIALQLLLDIFWTVIANKFYYKIIPAKKTILIYRNDLDKRRFGIIHKKSIEKLYRIDKELKYDGNDYEEIKEELTKYEAVFVAGVNSRCRNGIAKYCKEEGIPGFFLPHVGDMIMRESRHIQAFDSPVLFVTRSQLTVEYAFIKRTFDIISSALGLIVLSPVMLITAIIIRLYDGGPAIYKQVRLTKDGKEFTIYKFRSMRVDAESDGVARYSTGNADTRVTPIGKFIRKCRIDELPQLFNILIGDMSVVGPRPERPEIAEQYDKFIPAFKLRLQVKAGLTGYAQIYGKYNTDPYEKLEFDLLYINSMSVVTDLILMFATFRILFLPESTEGVAVGQTTATQIGFPSKENVETSEIRGKVQ